MQTAIVFLFMLILSKEASAQTKEEGEEQYKLSEMLVTCAAVYEVTSLMLKQANENSASEHYHNLSNGARTAAAYVVADRFQNFKGALDFAQFGQDREQPRWKVTAVHDPATFGGALQHCVDTNDVQGQLVEDFRKRFYGFK